jgi:hypothetical protein
MPQNLVKRKGNKYNVKFDLPEPVYSGNHTSDQMTSLMDPESGTSTDGDPAAD